MTFLEELTQGIGLLPDGDGRNLAKFSLRNYFNIIVNEDNPQIDLTPNFKSESLIDMEKLDQDHPLRPLLLKTGGVLSSEIFYKWLSEMFNTFFTTPDDYIKVRNYVKKIQDGLCDNSTTSSYGKKLIECATPFLESIKIKNKRELSLIWKNIVDSWLQISFPNSSAPPLQTLTVSYSLLDIHPLFQEDINSKNKLDNLVRDSKMVCYASASEYFVTEDKHCYNKTSFIYEVYNIKTKVVKMEELLNVFS